MEVGAPLPYNFRGLPGERALREFDWRTANGLPAIALATTHRLAVFGEHDLGREHYWRAIYDFREIGPARSFDIHDGDWYLDLGRMVLRNQRPYSHWEEV